MKHKMTYLCLLTAAFLACCTPPAFAPTEEPLDLKPPQLQDFSNSANGLCLEFDEAIELTPQDIVIKPELKIKDLVLDKDTLNIITAEQTPGREYSLRVKIKDSQGNSQNLLTQFYGYNPELPKILINEFTTQGSSTHPDIVELLVLEAGNIGGLSFYEGTRNNWEQKYVFPAMRLQAGDYILLHIKPQGIPQEIDETQNPDASQGLDASATAYDFWLPQGTGLSGNNGVLTLYSSPRGELLDGVLYSNRTSQSDKKYRGFGSRKTLERAEELFSQGGWTGATSELRPEDAVNPEDSTATRSINRIPGSPDSNSARDWMICASRKASFGQENSPEVYQP